MRDWLQMVSTVIAYFCRAAAVGIVFIIILIQTGGVSVPPEQWLKFLFIYAVGWVAAEVVRARTKTPHSGRL